MFKVCLILGGNLGDRLQNLSEAVKLLTEKVGSVTDKSAIYETKAWGKTAQPDFLNMAILINTMLEPLALLDKTQEIEHVLGRKRKEHWGARTMDIDILFYEDKIINFSKLVIPHPYIAKRNFVLVPLMDMMPDFEHPIDKLTIKELFLKSEDNSEVKKIATTL